ncbi:hypothetical protein K488DRAFT_85911 [Vararia minispora EC-137]|uniref:Uncharacterized protein n=1 Tax=Vararia minispora EC-137 TaxID=1314806 RepID=A0ACB8QKK8_9AGAM|nr:hypothetical protein K488DRAFT_85911 [Vararia minispora EC-137]
MDMNVLHIFPDNDRPKDVFVQANGKTSGASRHVSLFWVNRDDGRLFIVQVLQLVGIPGKYHWENAARMRSRRSAGTQEVNDIYALGMFSRVQRDRIISLASQVRFESASTVNNCQVWLRDLLEAMMRDPDVALPQSTFDELDRGISLLKRRPEA